ncbi:MAG: hypothetical protein F2653_00955 [Actinobacteria bacterium]|uniref:Unannotated protein n=1 Tax=freshwater metagenome TaxID=449393 RepID=A0A6J6M1P2_9ZZZZ|nr:hypothetical protein [Actinomycetota bacterium]MSW22523.1 hypothetical protein [Actinomycetota bacterium]MSX04464.1 hypothetical protein [Actinomycetota bacterium]MSX84153.1 hypothetical protein [Actinomycetota bacterium]MSY95991.1 hypothetical protein [Actinomycetota bacterium]
MRRNLFAIFTIAAVVSGVLAPIQSFAGPTATPGKSQGNGPCATSGSTNSQTQSTKNTNKECLAAAAKVAITRASVGTARKTAFTTQPQITIQDSGGNTVTSSVVVVTATVSAGGTLVGTTTATASTGVATFTGLGVDGTIGVTYTITYTAVGLTVATATVTLTGTTCNGIFTCQVGDTGPGGGKIFYVAASSGFTCGATLSETCYYLEAAPTSGTSAWADVLLAWSTGANQSVSVPNANGTAIGTGYKNSLAIVAQTGNVTLSSAAVAARGYGGPNSLSDWYLPSKDELDQLYSQKTAVGGFVEAVYYWSSTEVNVIGANAWLNNGSNTGKESPEYVRPVRAF